ncbi:MAG TPA: S8 family serine peptidase [Kofleriaceae bacterium]|nr:S8 family serine peptidase [Kofleriaceae bacterium]
MRNLLVPAALGLVFVACADEESATTTQTQALSSSPTGARILKATAPVPNRYIVVLRDDTSDVHAISQEHTRASGAKVSWEFRHALHGYVLEGSEAEAQTVAADPRVKYVQEDGEVHAIATEADATWGIDRIDQRTLPLDQTYTYNATGGGVSAYIIDTGIRVSHAEFGGRAFPGFTSVNDGNGTNDCNGHGTHVAGTVGGSSYGVAKGVTLYAVRVLDCGGSGTYAGVIAGIDWVTANAQLPAVANMSLGGGASQAVDDAVTASIGAGVVYAIAAGNSSDDACNYSPARTPAALTIGATTITDVRASYSNYGTCVDLFAPGSGITSSWNTSDTATNTISGTSMATPHVTGAAALYLSANPAASPAQVEAALEANATPDAVIGPGTGSPNLLLYTAFIGGGGGDTTPPTAAITSPEAGATVAGTVTIAATASDNVGVTRVAFYAGSTFLGVDTTEPYSFTWDTTTGGNGTVALLARAFDAGGNLSDSTKVTVTVNNLGLATYDPALKAPKCETVGAYCDTGTLVNGRATLGPELNAPNTINNSCADGIAGTYHSDESLDRIRVATLDGSPLAPGKTVQITATVWAWSGGSDSLDLYYTADATNPSWTYLTTLEPTAGGAQVLTATYTLPQGGLQAVRGNFRYTGTVGSCSTGSYDDRDDLVFAVKLPQPPSASFTSACADHLCSFTDDSTTLEGTITSWSWSFGDYSSSSQQNPEHWYIAPGTYTVSLTVTNSDGLTSTTSQQVTATDPPVITLSAAGHKEKGNRLVDLTWSGATAASVDVYRNGALLTTTANGGAHRDIAPRNGLYLYRVCHAGTTLCSNDAVVTF